MSKIATTAENCIGKYTGKYDCSGFVAYVYSLNGKSIPHSSAAIWSQGKNGTGACW